MYVKFCCILNIIVNFILFNFVVHNFAIFCRLLFSLKMKKSLLNFFYKCYETK